MGIVDKEIQLADRNDQLRARVRDLEREIVRLNTVNQLPSVGRIVHYVAYGTPGGEFPAGVCRAAIITEVNDPESAAPSGAVGVCVLNPSGQFFNQDVPYSATKRPGTWHWPERV